MNDLPFNPGQRVTVLRYGLGTVRKLRPFGRDRVQVHLDTLTSEGNSVIDCLPDQLTPLEDARVTTETTTKKARKSKAGADVAPVDFKKLAEETRAKMAAKPAPARAKRKRAVRQLHFQPGDFVSYRHGTSYLTALVHEVREGGYALELPQDHPVNGQWQVEATVEEVTPRVLPLSLVAPLAVGDRVARALFGPDLVPLSIEGDCVVQEVTADGEVLILNEQGQQWQGTPDQRLTLCGRADLNTALRDLGRPVAGAAPTAPEAPDDGRTPVDLERHQGHRARFPYEAQHGKWVMTEATVFSSSYLPGCAKMAVYTEVDGEKHVTYADVPLSRLAYVGPSSEEEQLAVFGEKVAAPPLFTPKQDTPVPSTDPQPAELPAPPSTNPRDLFVTGARVRLSTVLRMNEDAREYDGIVDHQGTDEGLKYDAYVLIPDGGLIYAGDYPFSALTWVAAPDAPEAQQLRALIPDRLIGEMTDEEKEAEERAALEEGKSGLPVTVGAWVRFEDLENQEAGWQEGIVTKILDPGEEYLVTVTARGTSTPVLVDGQPQQVHAFEPFIDVLQPAELPGVSPLLDAESREDAGTPVPFTPTELPGTPLLLDAPGTSTPLAPGTLGLHGVPLSQLVPSACNVRHHRTPEAIRELADSIQAQGQLENLTGRWNSSGQVEIVAGETRRQAFVHLNALGVIPSDYPVTVHIRELSDVQALEASATENLLRQNMTPLEECEAMLRLREAGQTPEAIAFTFGFRGTQPVADRLLVATNLHTAGRDLLDAGKVSLAQAAVIARASGEDLQKSMLQTAQSGTQGASARALAESLTRGQFLVEHARFDVGRSGLSVKRDLFDAYEPFFEDKIRALNAQVAWANAEAERQRVTGPRAFYAVESGETEHWMPAHSRRYEYADPQSDRAGLVYYVCTSSGRVHEHSAVALRAEKAKPEPEAPAVRDFDTPAYIAAHQYRADAARTAVLGDTHATLALTVWGLILGRDGHTDPRQRVALGGGLNGMPMHHRPESRAELPLPLWEKLVTLQERLSPTVRKNGKARLDLLLPGDQPDAAALLRLVMDMTDPELLEALNVLVAASAYDWSAAWPRHKPGAEYTLLAHMVDAPRQLAQDFRLTDAFLKRYPRHELVELAQEAGLGRALVEDCSTQKQMRARLLEHADHLHRQGFVPRLVRFEEAKE